MSLSELIFIWQYATYGSTFCSNYWNSSRSSKRNYCPCPSSGTASGAWIHGGWAGWSITLIKYRWRSWKWPTISLFVCSPQRRPLNFFRFHPAPSREWYQMEAFLPLGSGTPCASSCGIWRCISSEAGGHERLFLLFIYRPLWPDLSQTYTS